MPAKLKSNKSFVVLTKHVEESLKLLDKVTALVSSGQEPLTAAERSSSLKLRRGGEGIIPTLASIVTRFGVSLESHPVDAMTERTLHVQTLMPLLQRAQELVKLLEDEIMRSQAASWETATVLYSTMRRLSRANGSVAAALAPVEAFFAKRHKSVAASKGGPAGSANASDGAATPAPSGPSGSDAHGVTPATDAPVVVNGAAHA